IRPNAITPARPPGWTVAKMQQPCSSHNVGSAREALRLAMAGHGDRCHERLKILFCGRRFKSGGTLMLVDRNGAATRKLLLFVATLGISGPFFPCQNVSESDDTAEHTPTAPTVVVGQLEGGFDGKEFWVRPMAATAPGTDGSSGVGEVNQAAET